MWSMTNRRKSLVSVERPQYADLTATRSKRVSLHLYLLPLKIHAYYHMYGDYTDRTPPDRLPPGFFPACTRTKIPISFLGYQFDLNEISSGYGQIPMAPTRLNGRAFAFYWSVSSLFSFLPHFPSFSSHFSSTLHYKLQGARRYRKADSLNHSFSFVILRLLPLDRDLRCG